MEDCGKCTTCRDMIKFGGAGKKKKACSHRKCTKISTCTVKRTNQSDEYAHIGTTQVKIYTTHSQDILHVDDSSDIQVSAQQF